MESPEVAVIGGGIAGSCAALRAVQYGMRTVWFLGDRKTAKASRSKYVLNVDNMIGVSGRMVAALAAEYLDQEFPEAAGHLREGHIHVGTKALILDMVERIREEGGENVSLIEEAVTGLSRDDGSFELSTGSNVIRTQAVVLATGVMDMQPTWPGPRGGDPKPQWIYPYANQETILYCIRCEGHLTRGVPTAVLGHASSAAEVAMMLHERYETDVKILTHGEEPTWNAETDSLLSLYGIDVNQSPIQGVFGEARKGKLCGFELGDGSRVEVRLALVSMGLYRVYNDLAIQAGAELEPGQPQDKAHVMVDKNAETSVRGLFCVGDMAKGREEPIRKQIYTSQEYAVRALDRIDLRRRKRRRSQLLQTSA